MTSTLTYTALFEAVENGWTQARIAELPGVITAAPSLEEAKEWLVDALREYLLSLTAPAQDTPEAAHSRVEIIIRAA
jgi:predicted RNase H-like HicB family nuclease